MMTSQKQIEANRRNCLKSTGPKTGAGKQRSSQNSIKHGILTTNVLLPEESNTEFNELHTAMIKMYRPATPIETILVNTISETIWRLNRISSVEHGIFEKNHIDYKAVRSQQIISNYLKVIYPEASQVEIIDRFNNIEHEISLLENETIKSAYISLLECEIESRKEPIKNATAFLNINGKNQSLDMIIRYRRDIERSLYKSIDKLSEIQNKRTLKERDQEKHIEVIDSIPNKTNPFKIQ